MPLFRKKNSAAKPQPAKSKSAPLSEKIERRTPIIGARDIRDWNAAHQAALRVSNPRFDRLQEIYSHIIDDAHLFSQIQLRKAKTIGADYALVSPDGLIDENASNAFAAIPAIRPLISAVLDSLFFGCSLVEISAAAPPDRLDFSIIDRRHIDPVGGILYISPSDSVGIHYRSLPDFGRFILEFRGEGLGILAKAAPLALIKRFALANWSEFTEVSGIPPRIIKTNTQDPDLRLQYQHLLSSMGSGASGVIDTDDEMLFVNTNAGDGAVYENLIRLCTNDLSLLINGSVIGQDTRYGSNSKETTSVSLNDEIVYSDRNFVEVAMNSTILPALASFGLLPDGLRFKFHKLNGSSKLFDQTMQAAQFFFVDPNFVQEEFGIKILGPRTPDPDDGPDSHSRQNSLYPFL